MKTHNGALTYEDYVDLFKKKKIIGVNFNSAQIQPSSVDLTLSGECYEISASFLSIKKSIKDKLNQILLKKINLKKK